MNDKCSAGTGRFLEIMANRLGLTLEEVFEFASRGGDVTISLLALFLQSQKSSFDGQRVPREDIAAGIIDSICSKVVALVNRKPHVNNYF